MKHRLIYTLLCGISVLATAQTSTHASAALPMPAGTSMAAGKEVVNLYSFGRNTCLFK